jgi:uncharacterized protein (DUF849 family)
MFLKAAINGRRMPTENPSIPITPSQQAREASLAIAAGAGAIHVHPRDAAGWESLVDFDVAATLEAIRETCPGIPIGVSTGAWIVPDVDRRLALIQQWNVLPDFAGVNFHEPGAEQTCQLLLKKGVQFEAGIWNGEGARLFRRSGLADQCLRILIEPAQEAGDTKGRMHEIEMVLHDVPGSRLLHGFGASSWELVALAGRLGYDTRVGFEDTITLPDGTLAKNNGELVAAARQLATEL